ncbi:MAG: hypothetical protein ACF8MJ_08750 [Phycisphaerales bacterium JB050]
MGLTLGSAETPGVAHEAPAYSTPKRRHRGLFHNIRYRHAAARNLLEKRRARPVRPH